MGRRVVTLIPEGQAKTGYRFLFTGPAEACRRCRLRSVCVENLTEGRVYEVMSAIPKKKFPCDLHGGEVVPVEVHIPPIEVAIPKRQAVVGAVLKFRPPSCPSECETRDLCEPPGLKAGDRIKIVEVLPRDLRCPKGEDLAACLVEIQGT